MPTINRTGLVGSLRDGRTSGVHLAVSSGRRLEADSPGIHALVRPEAVPDPTHCPGVCPPQVGGQFTTLVFRAVPEGSQMRRTWSYEVLSGHREPR